MDNVDYRLLKDYLDGRLDHKARHGFEKQALNDPFLADALEGFSNTPKAHERQLSFLQKSLEARIEQQHENKNMFHFTWQRLSVAMAAAVIFTLAGILFWMKADRNRKSETGQHVKVSLSASGSDVYPQIGMSAFQEYLTKELKQVAGNKPFEATVTFTINPGSGKPEEIRIDQYPAAAMSQKIIEAFENGPGWIGSSAERIKVRVKFKTK